MQRCHRLLWMPFGKNEDSRVLELLADVSPTPMSIEGPEPLAFGPDDFVLMSAQDISAHIERRIEDIALRSPASSLMVRCRFGTVQQKMADRLPSIQFLDADEGPALTRARVLKIIADRSVGPSQPATVPAWRRQLIGSSRAMQRVCEVIRLVGPRRCTVLITGETGTGKEVAARAIHLAGPRVAGPFVALNCSAVPAALLEAELFGHTRGAFTGATQVRMGRFEQAEGGTLFLDEIGDLPMELQAKLLRVLQEREFQKLGSSETVRVDARVLAATNSDLQAKVREGSFREDLFYRLNVVPLDLPPLRVRKSDIRPLATHFLTRICAEEEIGLKEIMSDAWMILEQYDWPGNVRQLENTIASAVILSEGRVQLRESDFSFPYDAISDHNPGLENLTLPDHGLDFTRTVNALEKSLLGQALRRTGGNKKAAADMLGLKRTTLSAKIRVFELEGAA